MKTKPKIEIDLNQIEELAAKGLTQEQIADALGISRSTLQSRKRDFEQIAQAIKKGQAKGLATVANVLFEKIINDKDTTSTIFYLKSKGGWKETKAIESNIEVKSTDEIYKQLDEIHRQDLERVQQQKAEMEERQRLFYSEIQEEENK